MLKKIVKIVCTCDKDENVITQPNLSRTIRQILADTAQGKPSPVPLVCSPHDSEIYNGKDLHKLHICEDKFDAINRQRAYIKATEEKVTSNKNKLKAAEKRADEARLKNAEERGAARARANTREASEQGNK